MTCHSRYLLICLSPAMKLTSAFSVSGSRPAYSGTVFCTVCLLIRFQTINNLASQRVGLLQSKMRNIGGWFLKFLSIQKVRDSKLKFLTKVYKYVTETIWYTEIITGSNTQNQRELGRYSRDQVLVLVSFTITQKAMQPATQVSQPLGFFSLFLNFITRIMIRSTRHTIRYCPNVHS